MQIQNNVKSMLSMTVNNDRFDIAKEFNNNFLKEYNVVDPSSR